MSALTWSKLETTPTNTTQGVCGVFDHISGRTLQNFPSLTSVDCKALCCSDWFEQNFDSFRSVCIQSVNRFLNRWHPYILDLNFLWHTRHTSLSVASDHNPLKCRFSFRQAFFFSSLEITQFWPKLILWARHYLIVSRLRHLSGLLLLHWNYSLGDFVPRTARSTIHFIPPRSLQ